MTVLAASDVTVVIPARNAAITIGATLESISKQHPDGPGRVIVVDDGSTDDTAQATRHALPSASVLTTSGIGPGGARNVGIAAATTDLIAFCDADDRWPPDRLQRDLAFFRDRPTIDAVLGRTRFDADDASLLDGLVFDRDDRTAVIPHFGAVTARRALFDRTGPIREGVVNYEDYDWFLRVREIEAALVVHDDVAMWRTMHAGSMSRASPPSPTDLLRTLQRSVARRRVEGARPLPSLADLRDTEQMDNS